MRRKQQGFTLIELLIVMIIGFVVVLFLLKSCSKKESPISTPTQIPIPTTAEIVTEPTPIPDVQPFDPKIEQDNLQKECESFAQNVEQFLQLPQEEVTIEKNQILIQQGEKIEETLDNAIEQANQEIAGIQNKIKQLNNEFPQIKTKQLQEKVQSMIQTIEKQKDMLIEQHKLWQASQKKIGSHLQTLKEYQHVLEILQQDETATENSNNENSINTINNKSKFVYTKYATLLYDKPNIRSDSVKIRQQAKCKIIDEFKDQRTGEVWYQVLVISMGIKGWIQPGNLT